MYVPPRGNVRSFVMCIWYPSHSCCYHVIVYDDIIIYNVDTYLSIFHLAVV